MAGKRIMATTTSDAQTQRVAETSGSTLDIRRAELAHRHVRALNTQFASWVQLQLQNHPDELWEDGVRDYLSHASNIMEKFSDVVAWLRANTEKEETIFSARASGHPSSQKNFLWTNENIKPNAELQITSEPIQQGAASGLCTWSSSRLSSSQNPLLQGSQSVYQTKVGTAIDPDEEDDLERQSSPSVRKTEEKGIVVAHEVKCKVYVKSENPADKGWKDIGMGMLVIKCKEGVAKASKDSKPTIVVRNDVGKVLLNALIYSGIKMNIQKNTIASIFHTSSAGVANEDTDSNAAAVARAYLLRMKNEEETKKLAATIEEYAPTA